MYKLLLIAAAVSLPTAAYADSCNTAAVTRASVSPPAGNLQMVSSYCTEGICERVYERTVQPIKRSRRPLQRYVVRIEPDTSRRVAMAGQ